MMARSEEYKLRELARKKQAKSDTALYRMKKRMLDLELGMARLKTQKMSVRKAKAILRYFEQEDRKESKKAEEQPKVADVVDVSTEELLARRAEILKELGGSDTWAELRARFAEDDIQDSEWKFVGELQAIAFLLGEDDRHD
jgi:predicted NodU family carbamoyl transferase